MEGKPKKSKQYDNCAHSKYKNKDKVPFTVCATEQSEKMGIKKYGFCIPEEWGDDIKGFEKHLAELRSKSSKKAQGIKTKKKKNKKLFFGLF